MITKIYEDFLMMSFCLVLFLQSLPAIGQDDLTLEEVNRLFETLSNWDRWGADDQTGTVNHITPEIRIAAAGLAETGVSVSMAYEILTEEAADNGNPYDHRMTSVGSSPGPWSGDFLGVSYHEFAHSHLDARYHRFQFGTMYNGYSEDEVTEEGCAQLAITSFEHGIFSRGIIMNFPRLKGADWLENGTATTPEWLDEWEEEYGITIGKGDVVLIRTGRWSRRESVDPWDLS